ncbi:ADAM-TS Spacer 1, partial [Teladorsagia circumcincta]
LRAANGEFLLNGHYQVSVFRQQIPIQDVILEYSGSDNVVERINGTGPIRIDIYVHVLSVGNLLPPDISYEYMTAVESPSSRNPSLNNYQWRVGEQWTKCDRVCQGTQTQEILCMDLSTNRPTHDSLCTARRPQTNTRMCNIDCFTK